MKPGHTKADESHIVPIVLEGSAVQGYTATTPALPGCIAEGDTIEEALSDFRTALVALLGAYRAENKDPPWRPVREPRPDHLSVRVFVGPL